MSEPTPALLALSDVEYEYTGALVLRGVTLDVEPGEIVALIGRNGAGKSTLLRCAAGWSAPSKGTVHVTGEELRYADRELRSQLVLVTDTPPFYDDLSAREHIKFVLRANRLQEREAEAERLLTDFGIADAADAYPSTFSRGMRYKLALVMALALQPKLLLLDEPFGPIDPVSASELWTALRAASARGSGVLLSSHQLPEGAMPDRYVVLEDGRVLASGSAQELAEKGMSATLSSVLHSMLSADTASCDA
ncbi:MAG: ABC transporter ATP-binding protein [Coriobacteriia bacterium]|nr:ABC transporter ATP-binding protein [Coriobacteriia bacterium]MBN2821695.1 ABC transporter ATP-binding protein [Coriobacteriia bacterium]